MFILYVLEANSDVSIMNIVLFQGCCRLPYLLNNKDGPYELRVEVRGSLKEVMTVAATAKITEPQSSFESRA